MTAYQTNHDPTAVVGRRFGAYVIDALIASLFPLLLLGLTMTIWEGARAGSGITCEQLELLGDYDSGSEICIDGVTVNDDDAAITVPTFAVVLATLIPFLYLVAVQWIAQALTGATLGKAVFGIRTVDAQGTGPGIGKQFVRGVLWIIDGIGCGVPLVAPIAIVTTKGHRRVGDMAAGTYVVRAADRGQPVVLPGDTGSGTAAPAYAAAVPPGPGSSGGGYPAGPPPAPGQDFPTPPPPGGAVAGSDETATSGPTDPPPPSSTPVSNQTMQFNVPPSTPSGGAPEADPDAGPQWDADRNAYIQYDASRGWLVFDDASQEWKPLS